MLALVALFLFHEQFEDFVGTMMVAFLLLLGAGLASIAGIFSAIVTFCRSSTTEERANVATTGLILAAISLFVLLGSFLLAM